MYKTSLDSASSDTVAKDTTIRKSVKKNNVETLIYAEKDTKNLKKVESRKGMQI